MTLGVPGSGFRKGKGGTPVSAVREINGKQIGSKKKRREKT